jgi:hypothetical protein
MVETGVKMQIVRGNGNVVAGRDIVIDGKSCSGLGKVSCIAGNGKVKAERRQIDRIDSIALDGPVDLAFTCSGSQFVRVTADENILPLITTKVTGTKLHIGSSGDFSTRNDILVEVEMPSLVDLTIHGSGNVEIEKIRQPLLHINHSGHGRVDVSGQVDQFTAELNESGDINAGGLVAKTVMLSLNGSGDIIAHASEAVRARLKGNGDIRIAGQPEKQDCSTTGSGNIRIG